MVSRAHEYGEGRDPIPAIEEPFVIFMINKALKGFAWDELDVYRATQCCWVIGDEARTRARYALGVSHGVVRGAFRIEGWHQAGRRWRFDGRTARELAVVGTSIARIKGAQGNANPVRLFLNGIEAP